jgi:ribonucrease Y
MMLLAQFFWDGAVFLLLGVALGYALLAWKDRVQRRASSDASIDLLEHARRDSESILREVRLAANEEAAKLREQAEKAVSLRRHEIASLEQRVEERETLVNRQLESLVERQQELLAQERRLQERQTHLETREQTIARLQQTHQQEFERLAHLTSSEARTIVLKQAEEESIRDAGELSRRILESARIQAEEEARRILTLAIQRYAGDRTFETTTSTVALQGDDIKGRIIGREGRNIRAFEAATGITVLIDDTPNAVVLSGFDPVRREVAREAMQRLILDGRIHPTRIEEVVARVTEEMDETIFKTGEEALYRLSLPPIHGEIVRLLGRLRFRRSFSQNLLDHSIEVAHLMGLMAAEIGLDSTLARRIGLFHDIGKALTHEVQGTHAMVGAEFIRRHGESDDVVNAVASHHGEVPATNLYGLLVSAADTISASRPGARSETMTTYIKRLEDLEEIGLSFDGVEKCFAVQAGRELRVMVKPESVNDEQAWLLARNIATKDRGEAPIPGADPHYCPS